MQRTSTDFVEVKVDGNDGANFVTVKLEDVIPDNKDNATVTVQAIIFLTNVGHDPFFENRNLPGQCFRFGRRASSLGSQWGLVRARKSARVSESMCYCSDMFLHLARIANTWLTDRLWAEGLLFSDLCRFPVWCFLDYRVFFNHFLVAIKDFRLKQSRNKTLPLPRLGAIHMSIGPSACLLMRTKGSLWADLIRRVFRDANFVQKLPRGTCAAASSGAFSNCQGSKLPLKEVKLIQTCLAQDIGYPSQR